MKSELTETEYLIKDYRLKLGDKIRVVREKKDTAKNSWQKR